MFIRLFVAILLNILTFSVHSSPNNDEIRGSLCVINAGGKVVIVEEVITGKLSFPGGTIEGNESPKLTAKRETLEEAGIEVNVGELLTTTDTAYVYDCYLTSQLLVYEYQNSYGANVLPSWEAKHYGIEVMQAMLIEPRDINIDDYRYPDQWEPLLALLSEHVVPNNNVQYIADLLNEAPKFQRAQLVLLTEFQRSVENLPDVLSRLVSSSLLLGSSFSSPFLVIVIFILCVVRYSVSSVLYVAFALACSSLLILTAQQLFSMENPTTYLPEVGLLPLYGYSSPHLAIGVSCTILMLVKEIQSEHQARSVGSDSLINRGLVNNLITIMTRVGWVAIVWLGVSHYYGGVAHLSDLLFGSGIGIVVAGSLIQLRKFGYFSASKVVASPLTWILLSAAALLFAGVFPDYFHAQWFFILATLALIVTCHSRAIMKRQVPFIESNHQVLVVSIIAMASYLAMLQLKALFSFSGWLTLCVLCLTYPFVMLSSLVGLTVVKK